MMRMSGPSNETLVARFWAKVDVGGPDDCWLWQASCRNGYGQIKVAGRNVSAHRLAYELEMGQVPEGLHILHSCDTPRCCNPAHLRPGTNRENQREKMLKGRAVRQRGENHGAAKLTNDQVCEIRRLWVEERFSQQALADRFGVNQPSISMIVNGRTHR